MRPYSICLSLPDFTWQKALKVHPCWCTWQNFLFRGWITFHCVCTCVCITFYLCIHLSGHIDGFLVLAISATMNVGVQISFWDSDFIFFDEYPAVELLDHRVVRFLIFWGPSLLFSIVTAPIYVPTNSAQGFPFLHILGNTYSLSFDDSYSNRCWDTLSVVIWICISLMIIDAEHFFKYLLAICLYLGKRSSSAHFLIGFFYWAIWVR